MKINPRQMPSKIGVMLKCKRCGYEDFAEAINTEYVKLIENLEFRI